MPRAQLKSLPKPLVGVTTKGRVFFIIGRHVKCHTIVPHTWRVGVGGGRVSYKDQAFAAATRK